MQITSIDIRKIDKDNALRAFATIVLDDMIAIHDIKLIEKDHMFIAMPSKKFDREDRFVDIVHPINQQTRNALEKLLGDAYALCVSKDCQYMVLMLKGDHDLYHVSINDYEIERNIGDIDEAV